jgi:hypothetical protein
MIKDPICLAVAPTLIEGPESAGKIVGMDPAAYGPPFFPDNLHGCREDCREAEIPLAWPGGGT